MSDPAPDRAHSIAATNQRIIELHRELGIDPIFDPVSGLVQPGADAIEPLRMRLCPRCDLPIVGEPQWTFEVLARHLRDEHDNG